MINKFLVALALVCTCAVYAKDMSPQQVISARRRSSGGSGPSAGMLVWYRGDSLICTLGCTGTDAVTQLTDKSTNSNNAPYQSGSPGAYSSASLNGQSGVNFTGVSGIYIIGTSLNLTSSSTICAVWQVTSGAATKGDILSGPSGSLTFDTANTKQQNIEQTVTAGIGSGTAAATTSAWSGCVTYNSGTGAYAFYKSGDVSDGSGTQAETISANETNIGNNGSAGGEQLTAILYDMVVYNSISSTILSNWFTYTNSRYGV